MKREVKVFIISPDDVKLERSLVRNVCNELSLMHNDITIKPVLWEYRPMSYTKNPQESINEILEESDIFVVILWHRIGTVIEGFTGAISGSANVTGTQYEIEKILAMGKEHIHFYFKEQVPKFTHNQFEEATKQKELLDKFLIDMELIDGCTKDGLVKHGRHTFANAKELEEKIKEHLAIEVERVSGISIIDEKKYKNYKILIWPLLATTIVAIYYLFIFNQNEKLSFPKRSIETIDKQMPTSYRLNIKEDINGKDSSQFTPSFKNFIVSILSHPKHPIAINSTEEPDYRMDFMLSFDQRQNRVSDYQFYVVECTAEYSMANMSSAVIINADSLKDEASGFNKDNTLQVCFDKLKNQIKMSFPLGATREE